jgi:micrococcal nuclease
MYKKLILAIIIIGFVILLSAATSNPSPGSADYEPNHSSSIASTFNILERSTDNHLETSSNSVDKLDTEQSLTTGSETFDDQPLYKVVKVVDGDTVDVSIEGKVERLRLIGINTPETVDPRKPVECFGREASLRASQLLSGKKVFLESDPSQGERDKYGRLLRYAYLESGASFNLTMIHEGYAYEYTYDGPYKYQKEFKAAQSFAEENNLGLWGENCGSRASTDSSDSFKPQTIASPDACNIKGNISTKKEKIYHLPHCASYDKTVIDEATGEKWFCSEQEAENAGWRKALNC